MNENLQNLFSNLSSATLGYSSMKEWLDARCEVYEEVISELVSAAADDAITYAHNRALPFVCSAYTTVDGLVTTAYVMEQDLITAIQNGEERVKVAFYDAIDRGKVLVSDIIAYIQNSIASLQSIGEAFMAMAQAKVDDTVNVLVEYKNRLSLRFAEATTAAVNAGYKVISIIQDKAMSASAKITSILTSIGLYDISPSEIGVPTQSISGYSYDNPFGCFCTTLGDLVANSWDVVVKYTKIAINKVSDALLGVFGWTTNRVSAWWKTITGVKDAYSVGANEDTRSGPCFGDFGTVFRVNIGQDNTSGLLPCLQFALNELIPSKSATTILNASVLLNNDTDTGYILNNLISAVQYLHDLYVNDSSIDASEQALLLALYNNACVSYDSNGVVKHQPTITDCTDYIYMLSVCLNYISNPSDIPFVSKLSATQYLRFETVGAYISVWRYGSMCYIMFHWRPIDMDWVSQNTGAFRYIHNRIHRASMLTSADILSNASSIVTQNGWFNGSKVYTDSEMYDMILLAKQSTIAQLDVMAYQALKENGYGSDASTIVSHMYHFLYETLINSVYDVNADDNNITGASFAEWLMSVPHALATSGHNVITVTNADAITGLLYCLTLMSSDDYYCAYIHTGSLPSSSFTVMNAVTVMLYGLTIVGLAVVVAAATTSIVIGAKCTRAAFKLEAEVGSLSWSAFAFDDNGKFVGYNDTNMKLARKANFKLKMVNMILSLTGKATSEVVESSSSALESAIDSITAKANAVTATGSDSLEASDVDNGYTLSGIHKIIAGN